MNHKKQAKNISAMIKMNENTSKFNEPEYLICLSSFFFNFLSDSCCSFNCFCMHWIFVPLSWMSLDWDEFKLLQRLVSSSSWFLIDNNWTRLSSIFELNAVPAASESKVKKTFKISRLAQGDLHSGHVFDLKTRN